MYAYEKFSLYGAVNRYVQMCHMTLMYVMYYIFNSMQLSIALRDIADDLVHRKLRDVSDFEWQRFPRLRFHSELTVTEQPYLTDKEEEEDRRK